MKRLFLDTNFIIDYLVRAEYKEISTRFLSEGYRRGYTFVISTLTVANFAYIVRKQARTQLYEYLSTICELFTVASNTEQQVIDAIQIGASDFEDALQYRTAIDSGCDCIISRNAKHFTFSTIPVCSAEEYLRRF